TSRPIIPGRQVQQSDPMVLDGPKVFAPDSSVSENDMAPEIPAFGLSDDDLAGLSLAPDEPAAVEFDDAETNVTLAADNSAINSETTQTEPDTTFQSNQAADLNQSFSTIADQPKTVPRLALPAGIDQDELLLPAHASPDDPASIIVREHASFKRQSKWIRLLQIIVILVFVAIVVVDLLIDGGIISNPAHLPVTHLIN
ncbi:MAG: hypothetical protein ACREGF_05305, partial [Candidatus Saccharimonadales bacterium]